MNAKKVKKYRRVLNRNKPNFWKEAQYIDSEHPFEKPHQKIYFKKAVHYTRLGAKELIQEVPMKVGTLKLLKNCGRSLYKRMKRHNIILPL